MHPFQYIYERYGINQNQLAIKMGVSPRLLSDSIRRNTKIEDMKFETISLLAKALNVSIDELEKELKEIENKS